MAGISYDSVETLQRFAAKRAITFSLLSDEGSKTIDAFGIRNKEAKGRGEGIPHPATFIIDKEGIIRARLARENYRERHSGAELLDALKGLR